MAETIPPACPAPRTLDVTAIIDERSLSPFTIRLILLSWLITFFDGFDMMMISYTAPYMRTELALDKVMLGNVFSAGLFGMLVGGLSFSYIGDIVGRRKTIVIAAFCFGVLTMLTAWAKTYEMLLMLRFLDGVAIGGMLPLAWALNIEFVPRRFRASVVTIIMIGYSLGSAVAGPLTVMVAPRFGWEGMFLLGGAGTLVIAVALLFLLPESVRFLASRGVRPHVTAATLNRLDPGLRASADDRFVLSDERQDIGTFTVGKLFDGQLRWITPLLWTACIASTLAIFFKANWTPLVYEDLSIARSTAAYVASAAGLVGAILGLMLMRFTDRLGAATVAVYPVLAFPMLLIAGLLPMSQNMLILFTATASALISGAHFGILSIAGIYYPTAIRANGAGWTTSIAKIGGVAGPFIGGYVLSSGLPVVRSYAILSICPAVLAVSAMVIARLARHHDH